MKKIQLLLILLLYNSSILSNELYNVINNNFKPIDYTIDQIKQDVINGDYFLCVNNYSMWDNSFFKDRWKFNIDIYAQVQIIHEKSDFQHSITKANFEKFKNSFISNNCLKFQNKFPITCINIIDSINIFDSPNGNIVQTAIFNEPTFFYVYKIKTVKNKGKYFLIGLTPEIDIQLNNDIENNILGWVLYQNEHNVLTNLNIISNVAFLSDNNAKLLYLPLFISNNNYINMIQFEKNRYLNKSYSKDILLNEYSLLLKINSKKLKILKEVYNRILHDNSSENLKFALRQFCADFFEIDYFQVTDNFLLETKVSDFWKKMIGSIDIINLIFPDLLSTDKSLAEIINKKDKLSLSFLNNIKRINTNLTHYLNNPDKYRINNNKINHPYYWIKINDIKVFIEI